MGKGSFLLGIIRYDKVDYTKNGACAKGDAVKRAVSSTFFRKKNLL